MRHVLAYVNNVRFCLYVIIFVHKCATPLTLLWLLYSPENHFLHFTFVCLIFSPDQNPQIIIDYVKEAIAGRSIPFHTVAYNCNISSTNVCSYILYYCPYTP